MDKPQKQQQNGSIKENKSANFLRRSQELPETQIPSADNLCKFFKVKTKINEDYMNIQIGLLVIKCNPFQEDFVTYLINLLMSQCEFLNSFVIDPMHLYISMNAAAQINPSSYSQYLQLESQVYYLLDFCRKVINQFFAKQINQNTIFGDDSQSAKQIATKFEQSCIKGINQMHKQIFDKNK